MTADAMSVWRLRCRQVRDGGMRVILQKLGRLAGRVLWPAVWLAAYPIILAVRPIVLIRFGSVYTTRIGHFALDLAYYLAERELDGGAPRTFDLFYFRGSLSNRFFASVCRRHIRVWSGIRHAYRVFSILPGTRRHLLTIKAATTYRYRDVEGILARTKRAVFLSDEEQAQGWKELKLRWNIPEGAPIVCIQVRSDDYLDMLLNGTKKQVAYRERNTHKNADIETFKPAMLELAAQGYYCFRMGAVPGKPLNSNSPNIIDYANDGRSEFLDIFLCANCDFVVSTGSGIDAFGDLFRIPVVFCNQASVELVHGTLPHLTIFKRQRSVETGKVLSFRDIFEKGLGACGDAREYAAKGVEFEDNTPDEIISAVEEMIAIQKGEQRYTEEDEIRQSKFWKLLEGSPYQGLRQGRIGSRFLRDNERLLD